LKDKVKSRLTGAVASSLLIILIALIAAPVHAAIPSEPHNADAMWVEPSSIAFTPTNGTVGQEFNVTVWMNITENVFSYQIGLHYNRTQLECVTAGYTAVTTSNYFKGHSTSSPPPVIDTSTLGNGSILGFETLLDSDSLPGPHCDSLMWAEFKILIVPKSGSLTSTFDIKTEYPSNTWVLDTNLNNINIVPYNGEFVNTIPEFSALLILPIFLGLTLVAVIFRKRLPQKKPEVV
jgi:hypothetical protein